MIKYPIGSTVGRLTILNRWTEFNGKYKVTKAQCMCECGNIVTVLNSNLTGGNTKSCGCFRKEACRKREHKKNHPTHGRMLSYYKRNAKLANVPWDITVDLFTQLIYDNCVYCGIEPTPRVLGNGKTIIANGIDRLDSKRGYEIDNVVSCCTTCNRAKLSMSVNEFKKWVLRVAAHIGGGANGE